VCLDVDDEQEEEEEEPLNPRIKKLKTP